jgi:hypothetical protein
LAAITNKRLKSYKASDNILDDKPDLFQKFIEQCENELFKEAKAADADRNHAKKTQRTEAAMREADADAAKQMKTVAIDKQLSGIYDTWVKLGARLYQRNRTVHEMKQVAADVEIEKALWDRTKEELREATGFAELEAGIIDSIGNVSNHLALYWKEKRDEVQGFFRGIKDGVASASNLDDLLKHQGALDTIQREWAIIEPKLDSTDSTVTPIKGADSLRTQIKTLKWAVLHKQKVLNTLARLRDMVNAANNEKELQHLKDVLANLKKEWSKVLVASDEKCTTFINAEFKAIETSVKLLNTRVAVTPPATPPVISTVTKPARVLPVTPTAAVTGAPTWVHETDDFVFTNDILSAVGDAFGN